MRTLLSTLVLLAFVLSCDQGCEPGGVTALCVGDEQCQNGVYCDGRERCDRTHPRADDFGCVARASLCPVCVSGTADEDDFAAYCAGERPGFAGVDCSDALSFDWFCVESVEGCEHDRDCDDGRFCNGDERCDRLHVDADADGCLVGPAPCDEDDGECDEATDQCVVPCAVAEDADGDGRISTACGGDDCNDSDGNRFPGNFEVCDANGHDEDCDPTTVGDRDQDGDGYVDVSCFNVEGGTTYAGTDCDDDDVTVHPGQAELCNGRDDNCNGEIDEGVLVEMYVDADHDGFGAAGEPVLACPTAVGMSRYAGDCDDENAQINPGAIRCVPGGQGTEYQLCNDDGTWTSGTCPAPTTTCSQQPGGYGICL